MLAWHMTPMQWDGTPKEDKAFMLAALQAKSLMESWETEQALLQQKRNAGKPPKKGSRRGRR